MRFIAMGVALLLAVAAPAASLAQEADEEACAAETLALAGLSGWALRTPATATPGAYDLAVATLTVGRAVDATLKPVSDVTFVAEPERWPEPETYAGMFAFEAPVAGTYRVALSLGAWIDVVAEDELVGSSAFGHGPDCSGIAKMVEFPLEQGTHVLQLSGSPQADVSVLIAYKSEGADEISRTD